ncbi:hypothetical protein [Actinomyces marmotae]|uniref:DUF3618 domain-containing protein n=2 Tax=Actinomyces marmotae TaxID=2737173 RepID=A0A6M8AY06_9ACTO|nr:hypothetical protein [Actinomyces marmotae]QKD79084.1 hypothetical protein HPC72_01340 [Actinomyces marmotae]
MSAQPEYGIMPGGRPAATGATARSAPPAARAAASLPERPAPAPAAAPPMPPSSAPGTPTRPGAPSSPEEIQAALNARRAALAADAEALGERLAPATVKAVVSRRASAALAATRGHAEEAGAQARSFVDAHRHDSPAQIARSAAMRVKRFLDDAADGDPLALGVVSLAGIALAGCGITSLVRLARADRRQAFATE